MVTSRRSSTAERTAQWIVTRDIPTDVVVQVGASKFPLHKFMLVEKSGLIRRKIMESSAPDLTRITLSGLPGGAEAFDKVAKFCYGVNFDITVHNVAALRCAAEHLEMTDRYGHGSLAGRTEEFLEKAALNNLVGAVVVLRSCEGLLPMTEDLKIVPKCVDAVSLKACSEAQSPSRSPPEWWAYELASVSPPSHRNIIAAMRSCGATAGTLAVAVTAYAQKSLPDLLLSNSPSSSSSLSHQKSILDSLVSALLPESALPVGFLCCLLRAAIFLDACAASKKELERRISAVLDQASVGDLLTVALDFSGERIVDLDSLKRIVAGFVEREERGGSLYDTDETSCSASLRKVARTVDAYVWEIATDESLSVSKFAGIAGVLPKSARRFDDDLYRAVDIYLKAHPGLDEIEREKACGVMDPLKLSYEARLHASQNKRLPVQIVLQSLYYDQLKLRSGVDTHHPSLTDDATVIRSRIKDDASLAEENEALKSELVKMKTYISTLQKGPGSSSTKSFKTPRFFTSVSKTLRKLNPFNLRQGSKDTSSVDVAVEVPKPGRWRRRFSIS